MKRITAIVTAAMLMIMISAVGVFAATDSFELASSNPSEGYSKVQPQNVMVKLNFTTDISAEATQAANAKAFSIKSADGSKVDFSVIYNSEDSKNVNLLVKNDLEADTEYKVTVSKNMVDDAGNTLGEDVVIDFGTRSGSGGLGYFALMLLMVVVMVVMTIRDQRKAAEAENTKEAKVAVTTNPYKLAKEKNISVQEATKLINEEKEKAQKKAEKAQKKAAAYTKVEEEPAKPEKKVYKVKTKRTVKLHK